MSKHKIWPKGILPVIEYPNKILLEKSQIVEIFDDQLRMTVEQMLNTMYYANGIGLAAIQVGIKQKIITIDIDKALIADYQHHMQHAHSGADSCQENHNLTLLHGGKPLILINAKVISASEDMFRHEEGCLSFPGLYTHVKRPNSITIEYQDLDGIRHEMHAEGFLSICMQHEMDHTEGIVFLKRAPQIKQESLFRQYEKSKK